MEDLAQIERNKDKLDRKPGVDFVSQHLGIYQTAIAALLAKEPSESGAKLAAAVEFTFAEDIVGPQVTPEQGRALLAVMPESLASLSCLEGVSYHTFDRHVKKIPVPGYDEEGNLDHSKIEQVPFDEFPRPGDHPSRILAGVSSGIKIFPTPIPPSVSQDSEAVEIYQHYVFLHEFFHTIDYLRRTVASRSEVQLEVDGEQFTFQEWWDDFQALLLSGCEPGAVSIYAGTYSHQLNPEFQTANPAKFTSAVAEQICETFVAYTLGIVPNNQGWTDFRAESFGGSSVPNEKWTLMDRLCRARVLSGS